MVSSLIHKFEYTSSKGENLHWSNIPSFCVLTGVNGSGKTWLLQNIWKQHNKKNILYIDAKGLTQNQELQAEFNAERFVTNFFTERPAQDFNQVRDQMINSLQVNNSFLYEGKNTEAILTRSKKIENKNDLITFMDQEFFEQKKSIIHVIRRIAELIREDLIAIKGSPEAKETTLKDCLYVKLNTLLHSIKTTNNELLFKNKILAPTQYQISERNAYPLKFVTENNEHITLDQLSSGERVIFELVCYRFLLEEGSGKKPKLVLLDEFDAHLNPILAQTFIKFIEEYFVAQGIQVIMTTHSPSTVAQILEENLFWLEEGKITPKEKLEIIHTLASGFSLSASDGDPFLSYLSDPRKKYYLFTEGYTDIIHLKEACKKLGNNFQKILEQCNFFHLSGAKNSQGVVAFLENFAGITRQVIVVLDHDTTGNETFKAIKEKGWSNIQALMLNPASGSLQEKAGYLVIELLHGNHPDLEEHLKEATENMKDNPCINWCNLSKKHKQQIRILKLDKEKKVDFAKKATQSSDFQGFNSTLTGILNVLEKWGSTSTLDSLT